MLRRRLLLLQSLLECVHKSLKIPVALRKSSKQTSRFFETNKSYHFLLAISYQKGMSTTTATPTTPASPTTERATDRTFRLASQFRRKLVTVQDILSATPPSGRRPQPKSATDCNEVFPGIVLGNGATARNINLLKSLGITHVLNCAYGHSPFHVDTSEVFYQPHGIIFKGLKLDDSLTENISRCFDEAVFFIDSALLQTEPGKVFIHCREGVSRSATILVAYLMIRWKLDVDTALKTVLTVRWICPNSNFQRQLVQLECRLKEEDGRGS